MAVGGVGGGDVCMYVRVGVRGWRWVGLGVEVYICKGVAAADGGGGVYICVYVWV